MLYAVIFLFTVFISDSHQQCFSSNDNAPNLSSDKHNSWIDSRNDFSMSLFKALNKGSNQGNVIFSPSSVHDVLLLAYFGAAYETERLLAKVLHIHNGVEKSEAWHFYQTERQINTEGGNSSYPLKLGNKIFFSNKLSLRPCIQENLRSETELIDYQTNVELAINYINNWVAYMTDGEIQDAIKTLSSNTSATLVNAVLFKAKWHREFNPKETQTLPFRLNLNESKPTKMMVKFGNFPLGYSEDIKARLMKLPYEGDKHAMIILLPDNDLDTMVESLNSNIIGQINSNLLKGSSDARVIIPKYKQRNSLSMTPILEELGIGNTLTRRADFSRFTGRKDVFFNEMNQEAVIEVDEEGTKAAAVTVFVAVPSSAVTTLPELFICDRPFAYFIYDYVTSKIIFMGTYRHPVE